MNLTQRLFKAFQLITRSLVGIGLCASLPPLADAALIPPFFINSVVVLGGMQPIEEAGQAPRLEWISAGTGFFYGYLIKDDPDPLKRRYDVHLVTAKHLFRHISYLVVAT